MLSEIQYQYTEVWIESGASVNTFAIVSQSVCFVLGAQENASHAPIEMPKSGRKKVLISLLFKIIFAKNGFYFQTDILYLHGK